MHKTMKGKNAFIFLAVIILIAIVNEEISLIGVVRGESYSHPMNIIEWSGVVFVNQNITIPSNTVLTIRDDATIVFYVDSEERLNQPVIITFDKGEFKVGSRVQFLSLSMYSGLEKPPSQTAQSTDDWGFYFKFYLHEKPGRNVIIYNNVKVMKRRRILHGSPTFRMEGPFPISELRNCYFEGGSIAFEYDVFNHPEYSILGVSGSVFRSMESIVQIPKGGPTCWIMISTSLLEDLGIAINYRGGNAGSSVVKGVEFDGNTVRNVVQGIYSSVSATVLNSTFENFRVGILSPVVIVSNSIFDNSMATRTGIAILNNLQRKVVLEIEYSRFKNIFGVIVASDQIVSSFSFQNNSIEKCEGSPDFRFSLIHMSQTVYRLSFENNNISNSVSEKQFNIIHFGKLNDTVSFSNNILSNNKAKCILSIGEYIGDSSKWLINTNIFDNVKANAENKYAEICYRGTGEIKEMFNVTFNYWGSNVDKSQALDPWTSYLLISEKLYPQPAFLFVPYFLTSNVHDDSSSNIGYFIPIFNSTFPVSSSSIIAEPFNWFILVACITCIVILIAILLMILSGFILWRRKRSNYSAIN